MRYGLRELDDARDAALAPFHGAIAKARAEQQSRAEAETRKIQERNFRNSLTQTRTGMRSRRWIRPECRSRLHRRGCHPVPVVAGVR